MEELVLMGENLCRYYEGDGVTVKALDGVSFEVRKKEFIVVLGHSGSGKSTLLNLMGGMDRPTSGRLWYRGRPLEQFSRDELSDYRRDVVGFVFQFFNLIPSLTARENVDLAAGIVKDPMNPEEVLELVGLKGREKHFPAQLSGGEQQRIAIARALVKRPGLLLCDEPTGALDSKTSRSVVELLVNLGQKLECPVVVITHNAAMARIAHRVFQMKDGKIEKIEENPRPAAPEEVEW
ncbi:MAG: ABC transporter ATP-binding protein [Peptococcaceae bacterium]|nr:ABC transporter ATP-binding protein [Peptococcaceae bacterium]